jgi:5-methylcytosine-specific restriction protein A
VSWSSSDRRSRLPHDWPKRRAITLKNDPTCQLRYDCCTIVSTDVDHRIAGDDHRLSNLQGVCHPCHERKTIAERPTPPSRKRPQDPHPGLR